MKPSDSTFLPARRRVHRKRKTVSPSPAPTAVSIVSVTGVEDGAAGVVVFDAGSLVITDVVDVSQLEVSDNGVDWQACDVIVEFDATSIRVQNPMGFHAGYSWRVLSQMGITWDGPAAMTLPQGGTVIE